jgi:nicotinamide-nucleotide amidase
MGIHKVALLATGNEIVNGDILNTNGQAIAKALFDHSIEVGSHLTVIDDKAIIEHAMQFLLADHAALITIGGLGPTSDDKTRFALSAVVERPLEFHQPSWDALCKRLSSLGYQVPEYNRQQALFPKNSEVIPNPNGTAAACKIVWQSKPIYMLPGPPSECLPIFKPFVLSDLIKQGFQQPLVRQSWLLQGVGEGHLANELDSLVDLNVCSIGYRASYPYLELKLESRSAEYLALQVERILPFIQDYIISRQQQTASSQLAEYLSNFEQLIWITDEATGGLLQGTLLTPATKHRLEFVTNARTSKVNGITLNLKGLTEFWQQAQTETTILELTITSSLKQFNKYFPIRYGKRDIRIYAVELACWEMLKFLRQAKS